MTEAEFQSFIPTRRPQRSRGYPHRCVAISSCCSRSQAKIHQISPEATEILSVLSFFFKSTANLDWSRNGFQLSRNSDPVIQTDSQPRLLLLSGFGAQAQAKANLPCAFSQNSHIHAAFCFSSSVWLSPGPLTAGPLQKWGEAFLLLHSGSNLLQNCLYLL